MKKHLLILNSIILLTFFPLFLSAQETKKEPALSFYGFVRSDFFLDTYKGLNAFQDVFYLYPNFIRTDLSHTTLTVRYTVAIRQAPHPPLSFCSATEQIRRLLACDFTPCTMYSLTRFDLYFISLARDTIDIVSIWRKYVKN
jgi:hypothetical protein